MVSEISEMTEGIASDSMLFCIYLTEIGNQWRVLSRGITGSTLSHTADCGMAGIIKVRRHKTY